MSNRALLSLAWLAATVVMMIVTYSAVNLVGSQVTDQPIQAANTVGKTIADRVADEGTTTTRRASNDQTSPTTIQDQATAGTVPPTSAPTTSTSVASVTDTSQVGSSTSTSTTSTSTSTTQPAPGPTGPFPISSGGGVMTVSCLGDEIQFLGATPSAGYTMSVESQGPEKVEVTFSSSENEWELEARCRNGAIDPKVDSEEA